ncbi:helix-turn-helix domain-containing protein [Oceanobacter antarcticus]|uniref:Helix-turn-helix domain-containing protein n=1 Tax=Oceanobacter antarcticus TaxID=3133425 RepID=A0ABW8NHC7_9GAMM
MALTRSLCISTSQVPAAIKRQFWEEHVRQHVIKVDCPTESKNGIEATLEQTECGLITINRIQANSHAVQRSRTEIQADPRQSVFLCLMLAGHGYSWQGTRCANHVPGDIVLYDTTRPYGQGFPHDMEMLVVDIPRQVLEQQLGHWQPTDLVRLDRHARVGVYSSENLYQLLTRPWHYNHQGMSISEQVLDNLASLIKTQQVPACSRSRHALLQRSQSYIDGHLEADYLTIEHISDMMKASPRQLSRAFELAGVTLNRYIWNQRLERCRVDILAQPNTSLTDIAFTWGFNHSAHFSRSYKKYFGETPTETRKLDR